MWPVPATTTARAVAHESQRAAVATIGAGLVAVIGPGYVRQILEVTETGGMLYLAASRYEAIESLPPRPAPSA